MPAYLLNGAAVADEDDFIDVAAMEKLEQLRAGDIEQQRQIMMQIEMEKKKREENVAE